MAFLKPPTTSILESLDIGCLKVSLEGPELLFCNKQAQEYLQTKNPNEILAAIHISSILHARQAHSKTQTYTMSSGSYFLQLLVYPPDAKNSITILLIAVADESRALEHIEVHEDLLHDLVFIVDSGFIIVSVVNNEKNLDLQVSPSLVVGKSIGEFLKQVQSDCWHITFERAKATNTRQSLYYRTQSSHLFMRPA